MRKITTLSILFTAALGCSALALAAPAGQDFGGGWQGHGHHRCMMALQRLNLTDAQKASIKQIVQQGHSQLKPQFQAVRQQRQAFEALSPNDAGYQSAAASLAQAEANLTRARVTQRAAARAQIYNLLTSAQQAQLASEKAAFAARKAQWQQFKAEHPVQPAAPSAQ